MTPIDQLKTSLAGRYEIDREIGAGGTATVYLARDLKHDCNVALKLLNPELGAILGVERFLSEIKVTANLQHPNLLPLFDSGEVDGLLFYVMPFIEGETLRHRLAREKQLPVDDAVRIAVGIASALDYAHRQGVIHRDLKPENILLHDGQPLVADFGIALALSKAGGARVTQTGLSLGTPLYMSPEQATGDRDIDARTDIYSLGAVTYEMLAGEPPHYAATSQAIIARLMTEEPRLLSTVRRSVPPHVEAAVQCALQKLPADRFPTAKEFADALQGRSVLPAYAGATHATHAAPRARRVLPWVVAGVATTAALVALLAWRRAANTSDREPVRFTLDLGPIRVSNFSSQSGSLALSRDGRMLAFAGTDEHLYLRRLDQLLPVSIPKAIGATDLRFSPDGKWLAFKTPGTISRIAVGEVAAEPTRVIDLRTWRGLSWGYSPDIVYADLDTLWRVTPTGARRMVAHADTTQDAVWSGPFVMPDGKTVAFRLTPRGRMISGNATDRLGLISLGGGHRTLVDLEFQSVVGYVDGILIFSQRSGRLLGVRLDLPSGAVHGGPVSLVDNVRVKGNGGAMAVLSDNGTLAYITGRSDARLDVVDERGSVVSSLPELHEYLQPAWSPDGKRVAVTIVAEGRPDVWVHDTETHVLSRLTQTGDAAAPTWTADGKRVGFVRAMDGAAVKPYWALADGSGSVELVPGTDAVKSNMHFLDFTNDGKYAVVRVNPHGPNGPGAFAVPLHGGGAPIPVIPGPLSLSTTVSPDGKWISFVNTQSGRSEVYVRPFPTGEGRLQVSSNGGYEPRWAPDSKRLFFRSSTAFRVASLDVSGPVPRLARSDSRFPDDLNQSHTTMNYDVHPDGKHLIVVRSSGEGSKVVVVTNWVTELRRKMAER
jgi:serine/threonine protein kinase/Tol biopolymer transport system component